MTAWLERIWYSRWGWLFSPLAAVFCLLSCLRRVWLQKTQAAPLEKPVIVVGNITVGGSGKTPLLIALVEHLKEQGVQVGVISRGYGGRAAHYPLQLGPDTTAAESGDEPLMIYRRCHCPVVVSADRLQAARYLLANNPVDIIVSDDGLQHYRLPRDMEIMVVDGKRGLGNRLCLPAGPLRETASRLAEADLLVVNGESKTQYAAGQFVMQLQPGSLQPLSKQCTECQPEKNQLVHAVAGIGDPQRFFATLKNLDYQVQGHSFPDHYNYRAKDLIFSDSKPVLMTEKDAVKCLAMTELDRHWFLPVSAVLPENFWLAFDQHIKTVREAS